jgi:hypothetical protein
MARYQAARALLLDPRKRLEHKIKAALREEKVTIATETSIVTFCNSLSVSPPDIVFLAASPNYQVLIFQCCVFLQKVANHITSANLR